MHLPSPTCYLLFASKTADLDQPVWVQIATFKYWHKLEKRVAELRKVTGTLYEYRGIADTAWQRVPPHHKVND